MFVFLHTLLKVNKKEALNSVLVTGASSGSGFQIARKFAANGYAVFITSRDLSRAQAAAEIIKKEYGVFSKGYELRPGNEQSVADIFHDISSLGYPLSALSLNSANLGIGMDPLSVSIDQWSEVINTNIIWNFTIARNAAIQMKEHGGGSIVFTSSNTGRRAIKNRSAYIASKGGIISLAKALAIDLGAYNIRVNCVLPGSIKTVRWNAQAEEEQRIKQARVPIKDIADFDDLANAVYFLASDGAKNITGTELIVDGGADAQLYPD